MNRFWVFLLTPILIIAGALRLFQLGSVFETSDNVELAVRILNQENWFHLRNMSYGIMIHPWVELWVRFFSALGIGITEFHWKFPIALVGIIQVGWVSYWLRKRGCTRRSCLLAAAFFAVYPLHVMHSRYLWGYEVLGMFFVVPALLSVIDQLKEEALPDLKTSLKRSAWIGLYLLSHGFIAPFVLASLSSLIYFGKNSGQIWKRSLRLAIVPVLALPFIRGSIAHTLKKETEFGFYLFEHLESWVGTIGWPLLAIGLFLVLSGLKLDSERQRTGKVFLLASVCYFLPLWFGAPHGVTVATGYYVLGGGLFLVASVLMGAQKLGSLRVLAFSIAVVLASGLGTAATLFEGQFDTFRWGIQPERGSVRLSPGTKTLAYLLRDCSNQSWDWRSKKILALHRAFEPPNVAYYFESDSIESHYDLSFEHSVKLLQENWDRYDFLVVEGEQLIHSKLLSDLSRVVWLSRENEDDLLMVTSNRELAEEYPCVRAAKTDEYDSLYDQKYPKKTRFFFE